ncbi:type II toxin-antitoxin system mRNA interferase toxin, RelE/StbE family [Patescibacteria group bacterium]|nr:type II toxin-antitoxin system mRNA interferase toxin, RelE/StbE family [Patescibacteria group bacterium]
MIRKNINTPNIKFSRRFDKQLSDAPDEIIEAFLETLALFLENPHNPTLRNHALKENYAGLRSIDVTEDWRVVFRQTRSGKRKIITFHMLGTHKKLYRQYFSH